MVNRLCFFFFFFFWFFLLYFVQHIAEGIRVLSQQNAVLVETRKPDAFMAGCQGWRPTASAGTREVYSEDDDLEAVFQYLVSR